MLILTRREKETITVVLPDGREMRVFLSLIKGKQARIGFDLPEDIHVHRYDEEQILERNLLALKGHHRIKCNDSQFLKTWMDIQIPELNASAREAVRLEPTRVSQVWLILKKEFENAIPELRPERGNDNKRDDRTKQGAISPS